MLIDSHCHLNNLSKIVRENIFSSCGKGYFFVDSSIDLETSRISLDISNNKSSVYTSLGFHPLSGVSFNRKIVEAYENFIKNNDKIVAIGEIGLDYKAAISAKKQEEIFKTFIRMAQSNNLPITLHNRIDPFGDKLEAPLRALEILDEFYPTYEKVIFHCFSHSVQILEKIIRKNGFVSFSLNILRKSNKILKSLESCPLENLLLETDSPYMKIKDTNSTPLDIDKVYSRAAEIKGLERKELEKAVFNNFQKAFHLISEGKE